MCLQHSPWEGAVRLIRVRLFVLSKGWKGLCPSSGTPQNSLERHEAIVAGTWSRKKAGSPQWFQNISGVCFVIHLCPKGMGFFSSNRPLGVLLLLLQVSEVLLISLPGLWQCWGECWISSSTSIFTQTHSFPPLLPPSPICKYGSMHILLHTRCIGYF